MGTWGVGLYSDDTACDVRDTYRDAIAKGGKNSEVARQIIEQYYDDETVFWLALVDQQWKKGKVVERVKRKALKIIDSGDDLAIWQQDNPREVLKRRVVL